MDNITLEIWNKKGTKRYEIISGINFNSDSYMLGYIHGYLTSYKNFRKEVKCLVFDADHKLIDSYN